MKRICVCSIDYARTTFLVQQLALLLICSDPKHIFSRPYIEMLARRSKVDPLSDCPLGDGWKVVELDLDRKMSAFLVKCFFTYRGEARSLRSSKRFV